MDVWGGVVKSEFLFQDGGCDLKLRWNFLEGFCVVVGNPLKSYAFEMP